MAIKWDCRHRVRVNKIRDLDDPFEFFPLIATFWHFEDTVLIFDTGITQKVQGQISLRLLTFVPKNKEYHYVACLRFIKLASNHRWNQDYEKLVLECHRLWIKRQIERDPVTDYITHNATVAGLSATIFPFMQDYIFKATAETKYARLRMYEMAPCWAHVSLPLVAQSPQALYVSEDMREAFAIYQVYCYMHLALQGRNITTFDKRTPRDQLFQETLLHDFCAVLRPIELDKFRSILWYVSTLWAVMLDDESDCWSHAPAWPRADLLVYLCSSGLVTLRRALCAPKEKRITLIRERLEIMPQPRLSDITLQFSRIRQPFAPKVQSKGHAEDSHTMPAQHLHSNPIDFDLQLQLRATAWVFLEKDLVEDRESMPPPSCCDLDPGPIDDPSTLENSPSIEHDRYLNSSPSCYGGMHPIFIYY
ncbi:hypothetical protein F4860DRAFT_491258 [Xylaria cubensis]|nr:hypothetical protein F4860DRAFT_491258 [Xylaria cubensis]